MKHRILPLIVMIFLLGFSCGILADDEVVSPYEQALGTADISDVFLSPGADPSEMMITWYSPKTEGGIVYISPLKDLKDGVMPSDAMLFKSSTNVSSDEGLNYNHACLTGLDPDTVYAYQIVHGDTVSNILSFTTGSEGAFSFAFVGDPQIGAGNLDEGIQGWSNTLKILDEHELFSDSAFLITAGDQVNSSDDESEYDGFLQHIPMLRTPVATVVGNHDSSSPIFGQHYYRANESEIYGVTKAGGDSYFVYNNVLFMLINSNSKKYDEHKIFMEDAIADHPEVDWKIVVMHHPPFTVGPHYSDSGIKDRREGFVPIFNELDVDVVMAGHDHVYCRTYMMNGLNPMTAPSLYDDGSAYSAITDPLGILYVVGNSGSGSKLYNVENMPFDYAAAKSQTGEANISRVFVSDDEFTITTYNVSDMSVVDTFTIRRSPVLDEERVTIPFSDVKEDDWFFESVRYMYAYGMMNGTGENLFSPQDITTRGMFVTILYRAMGSPEAKNTDFYDVEAGKYYYDAVAWAAENGIVEGYGDGCFGPDDRITREQMALILYRFADYKGCDMSIREKMDLSAFSDGATVSLWAKDAMIWSVERGLIQGIRVDTLSPQGEATRAQAASIIHRFQNVK